MNGSRLNSGIVVAAVLAGVWSLSGCLSAGIDLSSVSNPVMVSPVVRVGDKCAARYVGTPFAVVKAKARESSFSSGASYQEVQGGTVYQVTETHYINERNSNVRAEIARATGGRQDLVVVVDELEAKELVHMSLFGYGAKEVGVKGRVYELDQIRCDGGAR
jgi:hypothetical protein